MNYRFVLVDNATGANQAHWVLSPPVVVGRCRTADITINDSSISRRHCQFSLNAEGALDVYDAESGAHQRTIYDLGASPYQVHRMP